MNKKYSLGSDNRTTIKNVVTQIGDIVGKTLGPGGRNYLLNTGITNDGKTIVSSIRYKDECEDLVSLIINDVASMADKEAGDGTTTSVVIATKLVKDLIDKVPDMDIALSTGKSVMQIAEELEQEKNKAVKLLEETATPITTKEELENVAFTSMENREIAKKVADAVWAVGKNGFVTIEDGFSGEVEIENLPGIKYPVKMVAPFQYTNGKNEAVYSEIPILLANHCFTSLSEINPLLKQFGEEKKFTSFAIVAKTFEPPFIRAVYGIKQSANFNILLLKTDISDDEWEDIAAFTGAKVINTSPRIGDDVANASINHFGFVKRIIAGEKETVFIGGHGLEVISADASGTLNLVEQRVRELEEGLEGKKNKDLEGRIARLSGGISIIHVDSKTNTERYYLKLKVEDAKNSCQGALKYGVVRGGGVALKDVAEQLGKDSILYSAITEPFKVIQNNYGSSLEIGNEVVDSLNVTRSSLQNAVSVAKILLTQEGIIADEDTTLVDVLNSKLLQSE